MNLGTIIVGCALAAVVAVVVRSMMKDKKKGRNLQCGGDCSKCGGHCG